MKANSIKLITLISKKILLQKKILKYNEMIKDIDDIIITDINTHSNLTDFEQIFNKLIVDFKHVLVDDEDESNSNDKMI
jgi:hypothetical protein